MKYEWMRIKTVQNIWICGMSHEIEKTAKVKYERKRSTMDIHIH